MTLQYWPLQTQVGHNCSYFRWYSPLDPAHSLRYKPWQLTLKYPSNQTTFNTCHIKQFFLFFFSDKGWEQIRRHPDYLQFSNIYYICQHCACCTRFLFKFSIGDNFIHKFILIANIRYRMHNDSRCDLYLSKEKYAHKLDFFNVIS